MWPYGSRSIEKLTTRGDKPEQLYGQSTLVRGQYLYVLGGTSGHWFTCDIHRYSTYLLHIHLTYTHTHSNKQWKMST